MGADPFRHVGRQDLTATVDLAAVRAAASRAGLEPLGETTAGELLAHAGDDLAGTWLRRAGRDLQDALLLRSALARLLDPRGLGGFRVLAFGRGWAPAPRCRRSGALPAWAADRDLPPERTRGEPAAAPARARRRPADPASGSTRRDRGRC